MTTIFCHECDATSTASSGNSLACPSCQSEFIEIRQDTAIPAFAHVINLAFHQPTDRVSSEVPGNENTSETQPQWISSIISQLLPTVTTILHSISPSTQRGNGTERRRSSRNEDDQRAPRPRSRTSPRPFVAAFVQQIANNGNELSVDDLGSLLFTSFSEMMSGNNLNVDSPNLSELFRSALQQGFAGVHINVPSALGDYVFGDLAFDQVISQLMEQASRERAPPPATQETIDSLPRVSLDHPPPEDQITNSECIVCKESLYPITTPDQPAIPVSTSSHLKGLRLSCRHTFHEDCIIPWLQINGTCPVCRSSLV